MPLSLIVALANFMCNTPSSYKIVKFEVLSTREVWPRHENSADGCTYAGMDSVTPLGHPTRHKS